MVDLRRYTRWTLISQGKYRADILGGLEVVADNVNGTVHWGPNMFTPDEARLYAVRLIEGAVLADGDRSIRESS